MEEKEASGMSHKKEDEWITSFWGRIGVYHSSVNKLENVILTERFSLMSTLVAAYIDGSLCYDSKRVFDDHNAKIEHLLPAARAKKKKGKKLDPIPEGALV